MNLTRRGLPGIGGVDDGPPAVPQVGDVQQPPAADHAQGELEARPIFEPEVGQSGQRPVLRGHPPLRHRLILNPFAAARGGRRRCLWAPQSALAVGC